MFDGRHDITKPLSAQSDLLEQTSSSARRVLLNSTPHTSHFLTFSHLITRTCVAQVVCLACAHHIPCVISMRSCCVFDSLRLLHFRHFAVYLLSYRPVFPPGHQLHLPRCGGQITCALLLMRTLALLPSTTLSQVVSPTTTTSRRLLNRTSRKGENGTLNDFEYDDVTGARR